MSTLPYPHGTGPGQIGEGANIDTGTISGTTAGKGMAPNDQLMTALINRMAYAVNENVDHIWSRMKEDTHPLAVHSYQQQTSSGDDHAIITGDVWCGDGDTASLGAIFRLTDLSGDDIVDGASGEKIEVTGVYDVVGGVSYYQGGFKTDPVVTFNHTIASGTSYLIHYGEKGDLDELKTEALLGLIGFVPSSGGGIPAYSSMDEAISSAQEGEIFTLDSYYPTGDEISQDVVWTASTGFTSAIDDGGVRIKTNGREVVGYDRAGTYVYCWNASDGTSKWSVKPTGDYISAIAIDGNYVYAAIQTATTAAIYILSLTDGSTVGTMSLNDAVDATDLVFDMVSDWTNLYVAQWVSSVSKTRVSRVPIGAGNTYAEYADSNASVKLLSLDTNGYIVAAAGTYKGASYDQYLEMAMFRAKELSKHWYYRINTDVSSYVDMSWVRILDDGSMVASYGGTSSSGRVVGVAAGDYSLYVKQTWEMNGSWGPVCTNKSGIWYVDWYGGTPRLTAKEHTYGSTWLVDQVTTGADEIQPAMDVDEAYLYALVGSTTPYSLRKYRLPVWGGLFRRKASAEAVKQVPIQLLVNAAR